MSKTTRVYEVLADTSAPGPAADYTQVSRFAREADAKTFAASATCYGRPATVEPRDASKTLMARWRREGKVQ